MNSWAEVFIDILLENGFEKRSEIGVGKVFYLSPERITYAREFGFTDKRPHKAVTEAKLKRISEIEAAIMDRAHVSLRWIVPHYEYDYPVFNYTLPKDAIEAASRLHQLIGLAEKRAVTGEGFHFPELT